MWKKFDLGLKITSPESAWVFFFLEILNLGFYHPCDLNKCIWEWIVTLTCRFAHTLAPLTIIEHEQQNKHRGKLTLGWRFVKSRAIPLNPKPTGGGFAEAQKKKFFHLMMTMLNKMAEVTSNNYSVPSLLSATLQ